MDRGPVNLSTVLSRNIFSDVLYPTHSLAHSDKASASFEKYSVYMDNLIEIVFLTTQKARAGSKRRTAAAAAAAVAA